MNDQAPEILLIDDDAELAEMLSDYLGGSGLSLDSRQTGEAGLDAIAKVRPDLVILDIMLPGMSGLDVLQQLRKSSLVPVIMLTARGDDVDRIVGLEVGADDYLAKPFNPRELLARIKAILRRAQATEDNAAKLEAGLIGLDATHRIAWVGDQELKLTGTEYEILRCLMQQPGTVVTREVLSESALGRRLLPYDRSIDTHISNLRTKLQHAGADGDPIRNQRGVGYLLLAAAGDRP